MLKKILLYAFGLFVACLLLYMAACYIYAVRFVLLAILLIAIAAITAYRIIKHRRF